MSVIEGIVHDPETGLDERRPLACDESGRLLATAESARPASRGKVFNMGSLESEAQVNTVPLDLGAGHPYGLLIARKSGVASPSEGMVIQSSIDGARWLPAAGVYPNDNLARHAPVGGADTFIVQGRPIGRFVRLVYRNGATPQTELMLELAAWTGT
jgi:hypothetical protein